MKNIIILILISLGGYAMMSKEETKNKLFYDAQDRNADSTIEKTDDLIKNKLINKYGFTENEIINLSIEYINKYPFSKQDNMFINNLDYTLRKIANLKQYYFRSNLDDYKKQQQEQQGILDRILGNTGLPNWAQTAGLILLGTTLIPAVISLLRKK